ncbi:uncharacterized protein LY79DRAFT_25994 [Colletotrichum navitas]|uniref:Uncharacterized protein n=1 Tax=Colletotrichum navitas TaxID=681940 RepID=A0AAD8VCY5_9PEZI|nr:uncharacterized protein LY79DRAFT_25994 [Colletotrichum navitas]KAK1600618.1 hypothetical protein LY79DRAFT_25994 [Colletotrichum navitas]
MIRFLLVSYCNTASVHGHSTWQPLTHYSTRNTFLSRPKYQSNAKHAPVCCFVRCRPEHRSLICCRDPVSNKRRSGLWSLPRYLIRR